jgi:hypothetical protein
LLETSGFGEVLGEALLTWKKPDAAANATMPASGVPDLRSVTPMSAAF